MLKLPIIVMCLLPFFAHAASFDCSKATTEIEKMICSNEDISLADEKLAEVYKAALSGTQNKASLKQEQRNWIKKRNNLRDEASLLALYQERVGELGTEQATTSDMPSEKNVEAVKTNSRNIGHNKKVATNSDDAVKDGQNLTAEKKDSNSWNWNTIGIVAGIMLIFIIIGMVMHTNNTIHVYVDYTDALMTLSGIALPPLVMFIMSMMDKPEDITKLTAICLCIILLLFPLKAAFTYNKNPLYALIALLAKLSIAVFYVLGILGILMGMKGPNKDKYIFESDYKRDLAKHNLMLGIVLGIITFIYTAVVSHSTRNTEFTGEILNLSFRNNYDRLNQPNL